MKLDQALLLWAHINMQKEVELVMRNFGQSATCEPTRENVMGAAIKPSK